MIETEFSSTLDIWFPATKQGKTYLRRTCGEQHWWWPAPKKGDVCLCGKERWDD